MNWTIVLGVDAKHLWQLYVVLPTWIKNKPSLFISPMIVFYDHRELEENRVFNLISSVHNNFELVSWPPANVKYEEESSSKWNSSKRMSMLSGFVHVPAQHVKTKYWLKLDTDVIAMGNDDWVDDDWFKNDPSIIGHSWPFTKPANQMVILDDWFDSNLTEIMTNTIMYNESENGRLNLIPKEGHSKLRHKRIASWCSFFNTEFTKFCSDVAIKICGEGKLPVASQDSYMWYMAKRCGFNMIMTSMKKRGWKCRNNMRQIEIAVQEAMK